MVGVPSEGGGFCIEPDRTLIGSFRKAEQTCAQADRRLCRLSELRAACELAQAGRLALEDMVGEGGWTSTLEIFVGYSTFTEGACDVRDFLFGKADCPTKHAAFQAEGRTYAG